jgi:hypothetical protein
MTVIIYAEEMLNITTEGEVNRLPIREEEHVPPSRAIASRHSGTECEVSTCRRQVSQRQPSHASQPVVQFKVGLALHSILVYSLDLKLSG